MNDFAPISNVQWIPLEKVEANDYNPNSVATNEMRLLYISIKEDSYTQPVVTIFDEKQDRYIIIDGFHRYSVMRHNKDIYDLYHGLLPCVVLKKDISDRMAATIRHNRARGKHSVDGMSNMVFKLLFEGKTDQWIMEKLGLENDELQRLKFITGFAKLFENAEFTKAWATGEQMKFAKDLNLPIL